VAGVLLSADGAGTNEIMRRTGKSKTCVWRRQERFMQEGFDGLLRDKTRPSRIPALGPDVAERVVALTLQDPPGEATHWTGAMMAKAVGVSVSSVQRIWRAHGLQPHRVRQFKLSKDPNFAAKLCDIVGLYVNPPAHAIVPSVDEKAKSRRSIAPSPACRSRKGVPGPWRMTTNATERQRCSPRSTCSTARDRPQHAASSASGVHSLNAIEAEVPAGKIVHVILDNYAAHKHPKMRQWLDRHERFTFHFTPTSCSWLNAVEAFFAKLAKRRLKRGVFRSVAAVRSGHQPLESIH
jgi:transposase